MKTVGWILLVLGILNLFVSIMALSAGADDAAGAKFASAIVTGVLGAFLISRGKKKEEDEINKKNWEDKN